MKRSVVSSKSLYTKAAGSEVRQLELTSSDDLGAFLGDMSLLFTGSTADPALQGDCEEAVKLAWSRKVDTMQRFKVD